MSKYVDLVNQELSDSERKVIDSALGILASKFSVREQFFNDPDMVKNYMRLRLAVEERELFIVLFLDSQHRLIVDETLFKGSLGSAAVHPRVVAQKALKYNSGSLIVAHNHPSGVAEPSRADRQLTDRLRESLALFDIRLLDHFIVGYPDVISFAERGWL